MNILRYEIGLKKAYSEQEASSIDLALHNSGQSSDCIYFFSISCNYNKYFFLSKLSDLVGDLIKMMGFHPLVFWIRIALYSWPWATRIDSLPATYLSQSIVFWWSQTRKSRLFWSDSSNTPSLLLMTEMTRSIIKPVVSTHMGLFTNNVVSRIGAPSSMSWITTS